MNWEAIGAIGEIAGAIAVIVTIGYLAIQIRQNTSALRSVATQGVTDEAAASYHVLCTDPDLCSIFIRGSNSPDDLNDVEIGRFYSFWLMTFFRMQNWHLQTRDRHIDDTLLASWTRILQHYANSQGFQRFWADRKILFSPEFQRFVDDECFGKASDSVFKPFGAMGKQR